MEDKDPRRFHCEWHEPTYDEDQKELGIDDFTEDEGYDDKMFDKIDSLAVGETYYPFEDGGHPDHSITRIK